MIQRLSHTSVYVLNQDEALEFYRDKLGFEVRTDQTIGNGFRWLTVSPKAQPDLEIVLMEPRESPTWSKETADQVRALVKQGAFGIGVLESSDIHGDYETL